MRFNKAVYPLFYFHLFSGCDNINHMFAEKGQAMGDIIKFTHSKKIKGKREKGDSMCEILKRLQCKTAEEILDIYAKDRELPVDIVGLANSIGINTYSVDFTDVEEELEIEKGLILGATLSKDEEVNILYRDSDTENRKRFTIAHEIAHCCLHTDNLIDHHVELRSSIGGADKKEYEANIFAGKLLIPEESLRAIYEKMLLPSLSALVRIFKVSSNVMAARLDYLNMSYYKDIGITEG